MTPLEIRTTLAAAVEHMGGNQAASAASGVSRPSISLYLSGKRGLGAADLRRLAAACGYEYVVTLKRSKRKTATV